MPILSRPARLSMLLLLAAFPALAEEAPLPAGLQSLPASVIGVTGSGDQLTLRLKTPEGERGFKPGDLYREGWSLTSLSTTEATLSKGGDIRRIGLNPSGALAAASSDGPKSDVRVAGQSPADILREARASGQWNGKPSPGLTLEETERSIVYNRKIDQALEERRAAGETQALRREDVRNLLGADGAEWEAMGLKMATLVRSGAPYEGDANQLRVFNGQAVIGPESFYAPAGVSILAAAETAGLSSAVGYSMGPLDAQGGRTMTKSPGRAR